MEWTHTDAPGERPAPFTPPCMARCGRSARRKACYSNHRLNLANAFANRKIRRHRIDAGGGMWNWGWGWRKETSLTAETMHDGWHGRKPVRSCVESQWTPGKATSNYGPSLGHERGYVFMFLW